jgi:DNA mismatch repair protein MutL
LWGILSCILEFEVPMSTRIKILPESLTNKIAAGEVVERPASVVKELVENSLDSGCGEIIVETEAGGKRLIKVTDDGPGMSREDALLALERHATSKIIADSDLFSLSTLGFRGEALPSIASVSRFTLATMERGRIEGTEIYCEGGKIKEVKARGMAEGTVVAVRNLFFNTPARLKFMKSNETEAGHVGDLLTRLAISRPEVRFTYVNDGRTVFRALNGDLRNRVVTLLGNSLASGLFPVSFIADGVSVRGFIAGPDLSRSSTSHFYTYINSRFIRDKVVQHAIIQGYRNFMERGRYPVVVLFMDIPPGEVDVNVHPTKHEVRFREQGKVHDIIHGAVASVLSATPWLRTTANSTNPPSPHPSSSGKSGSRVAEVREALARYRPEQERQCILPGSRDQRPVTSDQKPSNRDRELCNWNVEIRIPEQAGFFSSLAVIGQFNSAYIICQEGTDLLLIDQHAAHERVAFELLKAQFAAGEVETQGLLFPETMELSFRESAALKEHINNIIRLGFALDPFGGTTWLVKGAPVVLSGGDHQRTLRDILEELMTLGRSRSFADAVEEILARIACHSVVRGHHPLTTAEIRALFARMDTADFASNCPHGRPVMQRITLGEIEKMFKRV